VAIEDNDVFRILISKAHIFHPEIVVLQAGDVQTAIWFDGLIVQMQVGQLTPGLGEALEVGNGIHQGEVGQIFLEVGREAFLVARAVQQTIDIIENVFPGDLVPVFLPAEVEDEVGDGVVACVLACRLRLEQVRLLVNIAFVIIQGKTLSSSIKAI